MFIALRTLFSTLATALLGAVLVVLVGCPVELPARGPAALSVQIGTRQSCGLFSGLDYDTSCLSAVSLVVRAFPSRKILKETCINVDDHFEQRFAELGQILRGDPLFDLTGLSAKGSVTFELRGIHDVEASGVDRCADVANFRHWLLWGESDAFDLGALNKEGGEHLVRIVVDCRDCGFACTAGDCFGCQGIDDGQCVAELPESFCVPGVSFQCGKRCDDDNDCFEGARTCLPDRTCDTEEETGELCSPCVLVDGVAQGCNEGFACVGPPGATQGFCAMSCPETFCPSGTRCNRIGNNLSVIGA